MFKMVDVNDKATLQMEGRIVDFFTLKNPLESAVGCQGQAPSKCPSVLLSVFIEIFF